MIFSSVDLPAPLAPTKPNYFALRDIQIHARQCLHHAEALAYSSGRVDDGHPLNLRMKQDMSKERSLRLP